MKRAAVLALAAFVTVALAAQALGQGPAIPKLRTPPDQDGGRPQAPQA